MTKLEELEKDYNEMNVDLKAIQYDVKNLEVRILVVEKDVLTINKQLDKISANRGLCSNRTETEITSIFAST